ncbi:hypothetical protein NL676_000922 [Syzygium grande]|nr:hypothetical protein NL676_000922 [Syzygium grande]
MHDLRSFNSGGDSREWWPHPPPTRIVRRVIVLGQAAALTFGAFRTVARANGRSKRGELMRRRARGMAAAVCSFPRARETSLQGGGTLLCLGSPAFIHAPLPQRGEGFHFSQKRRKIVSFVARASFRRKEEGNVVIRRNPRVDLPRLYIRHFQRSGSSSLYSAAECAVPFIALPAAFSGQLLSCN